MTTAGKDLSKCRAIIISACNILVNSRLAMPRFGREQPFSNADCYVLLQDASKLFCRYVSEKYDEPVATRWSPALPEILIAHPERCRETLELVEGKDFKGISYLHFVAA